MCGFGSKFVENELKGALSSIHPKRKTKPTSQSNDMTSNMTHQTLDSYRIMHEVSHVYSLSKTYYYQISVHKM